MKTKFLHDTDLARCALLPKDEKRRVLETIKPFFPKYDYRPLRSKISEILNINAGAFFEAQRSPWGAIESAIKRKSKSADEAVANSKAGKILYDFANAARAFGYLRDIPDLHLGASHMAAYWHEGTVTFDNREVLPYVDPRQGIARLSGDALLFVFSVMQERGLTILPPLTNFEPCVILFDDLKNGNRRPSLVFPDDRKLLGFKEITEAVRETYEIWNEVIAERSVRNRKVDSSAGPLI